MTIRTIIYLCTTILLSTPVYGAHSHGSHNHQGNIAVDDNKHNAIGDAPCENTINVKVNGLVCDFCARALEKVFGKRNDVTGIKVDLDNGLVTIATTPEGNLDDAILSQLITDSGYNVTSIDRGC
jgi:copper chaperone CopZ